MSNPNTTSAKQKKIMDCIGKGSSIISLWLTDDIKGCINEKQNFCYLDVAFINQSCPYNYFFPPHQTPISLFPLSLFLVGIKLGLNKISR